MKTLKQQLIGICLSLYLLMGASIVGAQSNDDKYASLPLLSKKEMIEDLEVLTKALKSTHPALYWYQTEDELNKKIKQSATEINNEMSEWDFYTVLAPIVGSIHCGHSYIAPSVSLESSVLSNTKVFPFGVRYINGKAYCDYKPNSSLFPIAQGDEIVAVNNVDVSALYSQFKQIVTTDGFSMPRYDQLIGMNFSRFHAFFYGEF